MLASRVFAPLISAFVVFAACTGSEDPAVRARAARAGRQERPPVVRAEPAARAAQRARAAREARAAVVPARPARAARQARAARAGQARAPAARRGDDAPATEARVKPAQVALTRAGPAQERRSLEAATGRTPANARTFTERTRRSRWRSARPHWNLLSIPVRDDEHRRLVREAAAGHSRLGLRGLLVFPPDVRHGRNPQRLRRPGYVPRALRGVTRRASKSRTSNHAGVGPEGPANDAGARQRAQPGAPAAPLLTGTKPSSVQIMPGGAGPSIGNRRAAFRPEDMPTHRPCRSKRTCR